MTGDHEPIHLAGTLWLVPGENQGRFPRAHSFLIKDKQTALIDTGAGREVLKHLAAELSVDLVLITHCHPDHIAGNYLFGKSEILVPEPAGDSAESLVKLSERLMDSKERISPWRRFIRQQTDFGDQAPTGFFKPGQEIKIGRTRLEVIHTPGHAKDHCCFYFPDWQVVLSADIDLIPFGPWYGYSECDLDQLRASISAVKALNPRMLIPSHRFPLERDISQALENYAAVLDRREVALKDFLAEERTFKEIVDAGLIYGRVFQRESLMRFWEAQMIKKHLDELLAKGLARPVGRGFKAV